MRFILSLVLLSIAVGIFLAAPELAQRTQRSNAAFFGGKHFQGDGWRRWNVAMARLVAFVLAVVAVLVALFGTAHR